MSILEGWYNGRRVFADEGEELRRKDVLCIHCGAKMHLKLFPNETDRYHFVLQNGEVHLSVCKAYEGKKTAPALTDISPEVLIAMISKKTEKGEEAVEMKRLMVSEILDTIKDMTVEELIELTNNRKVVLYFRSVGFEPRWGEQAASAATIQERRSVG